IGLSFCLNGVVMLAGVILGAIGLFMPGSGKVWAIVGIVLNSLPLLLCAALMILGTLLGA
ncbi:MAG: hypothetical protein ACIALR_05140, partial [Blastopirellula sp. JB062]